jgi:hypothetical protein
MPPPLESRDRLSRAEFERRYRAMSNLKKAELIEGIAHMASPARLAVHARPHATLMTCFGVYCASTPHIGLADNATLRLDPDNEAQPGAMLWVEAARGGQLRLTPDGCAQGAPKLVAEIAASPASIDLNDKFKVCRRNGAREYVVWRVYDQRIDWFGLNADGDYEPLPTEGAGLTRRRVLPGLWPATEALLANRLADALQAAQNGLADEAHQAFVTRLTADQPWPLE